MNKYTVLIFFIFFGCKAKKNIPLVMESKTTADTIKPKTKPLLVLDAGHGAIDPGGVNDSLQLTEKDVNRKIVDAVLSIIDTNKITVVQTRPADSNIHRHQRINMANMYNPDLLLTVHVNYDKDTTYNGFELAIADSLVVKMDDKDTISIANPSKVKALKIATTLTDKIANLFPQMRQRKLKIRKDRIWMICAAKYPSVLLEFGFISNRKDLAYINNNLAIKKLAGGIVDCVYKILLPKNSSQQKS